jgi:DNA-binding MarR family transcriptional regulator
VDDADDNKKLTRQARAHAARMRNAIGALLSVHRTMTMQLAVTYLHVALYEGLTVSALAARCGVSNTMMSRHLRDLGNQNRHKKTGLELVAITQRVYGDRRERRVILTQRGAKVARQMIAALRPGHPSPHRKPMIPTQDTLGS